MAEVVNLKRVRKQRAAEQKAQKATENAVRFGQSKAARAAQKAEEQRKRALLDGHQRETE